MKLTHAQRMAIAVDELADVFREMCPDLTTEARDEMPTRKLHERLGMQELMLAMRSRLTEAMKREANHVDEEQDEELPGMWSTSDYTYGATDAAEDLAFRRRIYQEQEHLSCEACSCCNLNQCGERRCAGGSCPCTSDG